MTAVAAALDGQRVALIAGGRLYVAAVNLDGGGVSIGPPRALVTSLTGLTRVDWSREDRLVVAGSAGQPAIYEISVDGALETPLRTDVGAKVTHLAAYPTNRGVRAAQRGVHVRGERVAYRGAHSNGSKPDQVRDVARAAGRGPSRATRPPPSSSTDAVRGLWADLADLVLPADCAGCGSAGPACGTGSAPPASAALASLRPATGPAQPRPAGPAALRRARPVRRVRCGRACWRTRSAAGTGWPARSARCSPRWSRRRSAGPVRWRWCRCRTPRRRPGPRYGDHLRPAGPARARPG